MRNTVFNRIIVLLLGVSIVLTGCSRGPEKKPVSQKLKIAVAFSDLELDGNKIIRQVMEERGKKENVEITFLDAKNDAQEQMRQIGKISENKGQQIKAVIVQPVDSGAIAPVIESLIKAGIKILALENLPQKVPADGFIASDHNLAGQLLARYVLNAFPRASAGSENIKAIILRGDPSDQFSADVVAGIRSVLKENPRIQIVQETEHAKSDPVLAANTVRQLLEKYNNQIDVIMATDSRLAMAGVEALKSTGIDNRVLTLGVGANKKASKAILADEHDAEIDTMPELLAQYCFDAAVNLVNTDHWQYDTHLSSGYYSIPARITPVRLIQKSNAYLLAERWGNELSAQGVKNGSADGKEERDSNSGSRANGSSSDTDTDSDSGSNNGQGGSENKGGEMQTRLRITTQEGKKVEVNIPGQIKNIETTEEGQKKSSSLKGTNNAGSE